jgi:hypothetical protein
LRKLRNSIVNTTGHRGNTKHPLYRRWRSMITRCYYPSSSEYVRYGAVGIQMHPTWLDFNNFVKDMGIPSDLTQQLDRLDGSGNYGPENCRWVTPSQNTVNSKARNGRKWKGCYRDIHRSRWFASLTVDSKSFYIGSYTTEQEAASAYNEVAREWYGQYASLNILAEK